VKWHKWNTIELKTAASMQHNGLPHAVLQKRSLQMLSTEQCEKLTLAQAEQQLAEFNRNKLLDLSLLEHPELMPQVDELANQLVFLEDRVRYLQQLVYLERANQARWANEE
jgi:hypothetical protein